MIVYDDPRKWAKRVLKDDGWLSDIPCTGTVPDLSLIHIYAADDVPAV